MKTKCPRCKGNGKNTIANGWFAIEAGNYQECGAELETLYKEGNK